MEREQQQAILKTVAQLDELYNMIPEEVKADAFDGTRKVAQELNDHEHYNLRGTMIGALVIGLREIGLDSQDSLKLISKYLEKGLIS